MASEVADRASDSLQVSGEATSAVAAITSAMEEIRERVDAIARDIVTLSDRTQQIGEITATVNGLADKSKLLALNASIEAARAGEHGKGFAVVAEEVTQAGRAVQGRHRAGRGDPRRRPGRDFGGGAAPARRERRSSSTASSSPSAPARASAACRTPIQESFGAAQQIAASAHQQSVGIEQIAQAMNHVDEGTSQFLEGAHQSQMAAEKLNELSAQLAAVTERYRV